MAPVVPDPRKIAFLQRYTPRGKKSMWSQINRDHIARLTRAGLMQQPGRAQVDAAKADGRWAAADAPIRSASKDTVPADLREEDRGPGRHARSRRDDRARTAMMPSPR